MNLEVLKQGASLLAETAVKTTRELTEKGKQRMDRLAAERHLAKTQRQLGVVVYSLYKNGEGNPELVKKYAQAVERAEHQLAQISAQTEQDEQTAQAQVEQICLHCGAEVQKDATFCSGCGQRLRQA